MIKLSTAATKEQHKHILWIFFINELSQQEGATTQLETFKLQCMKLLNVVLPLPLVMHHYYDILYPNNNTILYFSIGT